MNPSSSSSVVVPPRPILSRLLPAILILAHPISLLICNLLIAPWLNAGPPAQHPPLDEIWGPLVFSAVFLVLPEFVSGGIVALGFLVGVAVRVLVKKRSPGRLLDGFLISLALAVISGFNLAFLARQWRQ